MKKLKMHSPDQTDENVARIRELFPNCVTEVKDEEGAVRYAVDLDQLRQELSDHVVEGPQERYQISWPGKREALLSANSPIAKTLRPDRKESVDFDSTKNLFIEGDNLEGLKLLQDAYLGKIKMIYIDPPYNTGNDFIYEDDFSDNADEYLIKTNQKSLEGERLIANTQSNGRFHSDWLSMMYSRIKLARSLLSPDGVMFISIDDNEGANLIKIGAEIFGEENFVAQIAVQLNPRGRHLDRYVANTHESILVFVKDGMNPDAIQGLEKEGRMVDEYNKKDAKGPFRLLGLRNRNQSFNPVTRPNLYFPLFVNPGDGSVATAKSSSHSVEVWPDAPDGTKTCWTWGRDKVKTERDLLCAESAADGWRIFRKDHLLGDEGEVARSLVKSLWTDKEITNDYGRKAIKDLFGQSLMDFPKSPELMAKLVRMGTRKDSIVLDFFAGSASTAHGVMLVNAEDGGNRKFFMIQLPEVLDESSAARKAGYSSIAELARERIRRSGKSLSANGTNVSWLGDFGFRALNIDTSNMADVYYKPDATKQDDLLGMVDNVKSGRGSSEDLLFQVLVDWGVDLTLPVRKEAVEGKTVFFVNTEPYDLIACFDTGVSEDLVKELARRKPLRIVFRDSGFVSDAVKINVDQIFRQLSPSTGVKSI